MKKKPLLSFWQIWNMSFGFFGIQFGFALQNANVSRIFETLGAKIDDIPILWIAAPVTGLIIQPIIGHMSDGTWNKLGRRRPYFLVGAILASLALFVMPNSPALWIAAGMLWIMDASINISMEPFRAFVGDMLPSEQRTRGFAMQSFFIGTGAVIASALPYMLTNWLKVPTTAPAGIVPMSVKMSFYIGAVVFIASVIWTVIRTKEYSPKELDDFNEAEKNDNSKTASHETTETVSEFLQQKCYSRGGILFFIGVVLSVLFYYLKLEKEMYILSVGITFFGIMELIAGAFQSAGNSRNGLVSIVNDLNHMPKTMIQLAFVQFFSWFALFSMWIYTTSAVTSHIYHVSGDPNSPIFNDAVFNQGANWVGVCFAVYNGFAAVFAFWLMWLARKTNRKITHAISLIIGGLSFISIYFIGNPTFLLVPFIGVGLAWASILAMPYAILTGSLPSNKMGVYMGIFNFFIVIPQILAASILGFFTRSLFGGEAIYALMLGGFSMCLAALLVIFVKDDN